MRLPLTTIPIEFKYAQSPAAMYLTPTNDLTSIFVDGKLKPGTYKIQNLASKTYLEVLEHSNELCCRPDSVLTPDDAAWDFQASGSGYSIKKVRKRKPDQFCNALGGFTHFGFGGMVSVAAFPAVWRVEVAEDIQQKAFGCVQIFWGSTDKVLDLSWCGSAKDGAKVALWERIASDPWRIWKLVPVQEGNALTGLDAGKHNDPPSYSAK